MTTTDLQPTFEPIYHHYKSLEQERNEREIANSATATGRLNSTLKFSVRILNLLRISIPSTISSFYSHFMINSGLRGGLDGGSLAGGAAEGQGGEGGVMQDKSREWTLKYRILVGIMKSWMGGLGKNASKISVTMGKPTTAASTSTTPTNGILTIKPKVLQIQKTTSRPTPIPKEKSRITQDSFVNRQNVIDFLYHNGKGEWPEHAAELCNVEAEFVDYIDSPTSLATNRRTIVIFFHGGAHILGSKEMYRFLSYRFSQTSRASIYAVNYRLAPVNPYPCAVIDGVSSVLHIQEKYPECKIMVAGDSAGGNLASAVILVLRDMGLPNVDGALLMSPWLDLSQSMESMKTNAAFDYLPAPFTNDAEHSHAVPGRRHFYTADCFHQLPYVSPFFAPNLSNLPPILIQVGGAELLRDEDIEFGKRCSVAAAASLSGKSIHIQVEEYLSHAHDFQMFGAFDKGARVGVKRAGQFMKAIGNGGVQEFFGSVGAKHVILGFNGDLEETRSLLNGAVLENHNAKTMAKL